MATTFYSDLLTGDVPLVHRANKQGVPLVVTAVVKIPSGTDLASGDLIKFMRLGEKTSIQDVRLSIDGDLDTHADTPTLTGSLGLTQALNPAGTALTVDNKTGTTYASPATSAAYLVADAANALRDILRAPGVAHFVAGQSGLDNELANYDADGYAGPADVTLTTTANSGGATSADVYLRLTATIVYKEATQGEFTGALATAYRNRYTVAGSSQGLKS